MPKGLRYRHVTITPSMGGALVASASDDVAGSANYVEKVNFRREVDGELRREGWEMIRETGADDALDSEYPIRLIYQFPSTTGEGILIAVAGGTIYRLNAALPGYVSPDTYVDNTTTEFWDVFEEDFWWIPIYTGLKHMDTLEADGTLLNPMEGGAYRWEAVTVANHLIINNGVDLPIIYKEEWATAHPLYSLREQGIVSVGTIESYQDRLFCADLVTIVDGFEGWFTEAVDHDPYGSVLDSDQHVDNGGTVKTQRYQYTMLYSMEGYPTIFDTAESGGLNATLTVQANGTYFIEPDWDFAVHGDGLSDDATPYVLSAAYLDTEAVTIYSGDFGIKTIDDNYYISNNGVTSRIFLASTGTPGEYKLVNHDGTDVAFQPIDVTGGACSKDPSVNTSEALCSQAGGTWTANTGSNLAVASYEIQISPYLNRLLPQLIASFREFSDDGSMIHKMKRLSDKLVVYRDTGFFFLSKSNVDLEPFSIDPRYRGGRVPDFRHTIIDIDGRQHLFMGHNGVYAINRSSAEPEPVLQFELGPPFWKDVAPEFAEYVYAVDNPVTREMFISAPLGYLTNSKGEYVDEKGALSVKPVLEWGVIAYDYINKTLSTIDASFTACAWVRRPRHKRVGPEQAWFLMGIHQSSNNVYVGTQFRNDDTYGGVLVRYGYGPPEVGSIDPYRVYSRLLEGYTSKIRSGLIDFGDSYSDKEIRGYVLELSNKYGVTPIKVVISTSSAVQGTEQIETMTEEGGIETKHVVLNAVRDENLIPLYIRAPYIRDEVSVPPEYTIETAYTQPDYYKMTVNANGGYLTGYALDNVTVASNPVKVVGRTFDVSGVDTRQVQQTIGGQGAWPA